MRDETNQSAHAGFLSAWTRFWFTPMDPLVLGVMRWGCGLITLYTLGMYSFALQDFMGPQAWLDLQIRLKSVQGRPNSTQLNPQNPLPLPTPPPTTSDEEKAYLEQYREIFGVLPPGPHPRNRAEADYCIQFRKQYGIDLRYFGLPPPRNEEQHRFLVMWMNETKVLPPSRYPFLAGTDNIDWQRAEQDLEDFAFFGEDPHAAPSRGITVFSVWFHLEDPTTIAIVHGLFVLSAFLFTIGFATRITSVVTWFAALCYIHRSPISLFGVDSMMMILLLYLMIGPSGATLSVDRWLARRRGETTPDASVPANFVLRMLQIHLCIIYFMAGISKLLGQSWWTGVAVWNTLANFEHSPMQHDWYVAVLQTLSVNPYVFNTIMTAATFFTVGCEISYPYLVWRPRWRWLVLGSVLFLHGLIGLCMGLRTFSLMMLTMNLAFVTPEEIRRALAWVRPA
jgi:hypothetical protein